MHLALLMTNTDESAFANAHPRDGKKFADMIRSVRPDWEVTSFAVKDGEFPDDISTFDGVMISGSPASVRDGFNWITRLEDTIRQCFTANQPMFGACFGHQAIAQALGGRIEHNPNGWVFGTTQVQTVGTQQWTGDLADHLHQYAAHIEHVAQAPDGATPVLHSDFCDNAGFAIGNFVYTTQNHPEMTHSFIEELVAEYASKLPEEVAQRAKASLRDRADTHAYAESIAQFFEIATE